MVGPGMEGCSETGRAIEALCRGSDGVPLCLAHGKLTQKRSIPVYPAGGRPLNCSEVQLKRHQRFHSLFSAVQTDP